MLTHSYACNQGYDELIGPDGSPEPGPLQQPVEAHGALVTQVCPS